MIVIIVPTMTGIAVIEGGDHHFVHQLPRTVKPVVGKEGGIYTKQKKEPRPHPVDSFLCSTDVAHTTGHRKKNNILARNVRRFSLW